MPKPAAADSVIDLIVFLLFAMLSPNPYTAPFMAPPMALVETSLINFLPIDDCIAFGIMFFPICAAAPPLIGIALLPICSAPPIICFAL